MMVGVAAVILIMILTSCSASSPSAFQGVVAVAGDWQFRTTTTTVTLGATDPGFPIPTVGMLTTGQWRLSQNGTVVSGEGVNAATGAIFPLAGGQQGGSLTLESLGTHSVCGQVRIRLNLRMNAAGTELQGTGISEVGSCFRSEEALLATRVV